MSWKEPFKERERAHEEHFFQQRETIERRKAKEAHDREVAVRELGLTTGISDGSLLGELVDHEIRSETAAGFDLFPEVLIAWADGPPTRVQREKIRSDARARGIDHGASAALLEAWLQARPAARLGDLWLEYTQTRCSRMAPNERELMRYALLHDAGKLARSARGFLGMRVRMSRKAAALLTELEGPFGKATP